jgi:hypothetical protein
MAAAPVVEHGDVLEQIAGSLVVDRIAHAMHPLILEALGRSSSLMRRRRAFGSRWLIRAEGSGSASAWVGALRHCSSSCGYTPRSRHQALLLASSIAAVSSTAANRTDAAQARSPPLQRRR